METRLPKQLIICGKPYAIRWDYRAALDIFAALNDVELDDRARAEALLDIFYPAWYQGRMPQEHIQEAIRQAFWFLRGGEDAPEPGEQKKPQLVDWEQDFPLIAAPVSRILGRDVRGMRLHWWSFLAAYMEIGDCTFAQVVAIRRKKAKGKALDKSERQWYRENRKLVDIKTTYTQAEKDALAYWGVK